MTQEHPDLASLTERQRTIMKVIREAVARSGYPPSIREIGDAVGLQSTSSVAYQLKVLEKKGFVRRDPNKPRAVDVRTFSTEASESLAPKRGVKNSEPHPKPAVPEELVSQSDSVHYIPIVGQIAAGNPILAEQNIESYFPLPGSVVGGGELFMLQVSGHSMTDAGILDGDWVVVRSQPQVDNGQICAALVDGEATVKEFSANGSSPRLLPHNPAFSPIPLTKDCSILGRVVTVLRSL